MMKGCSLAALVGYPMGFGGSLRVSRNSRSWPACVSIHAAESMLRIARLALLFLLLPAPARAQVSASLPTTGERQAADIASYITLGVELAMDTKASWDCPDRARCLWMQLLRDGTTYGLSEVIKRTVHEKRPCEPACGVDSGTGSFPSMHMAFAFSTVDFMGKSKPRIVASLSLAVGTGEGRVLAGKHNWWDVIAGAGLGFATSWIR